MICDAARDGREMWMCGGKEVKSNVGGEYLLGKGRSEKGG